MFKKTYKFLAGLIEILKKNRLICMIAKFLQKIVMFLGRNSKKFAVGAFILFAVSLAGMLMMMHILINEYPNYTNNLRSELKTIVNTIEQDKGDTKRAEVIAANLAEKNKLMRDIVVTDKEDNILFSLKEGYFSKEGKALSKEQPGNKGSMKKFIVFSDWGGFNYILDENRNLRFVTAGIYAISTARNFYNFFNQSSTDMWLVVENSSLAGPFEKYNGIKSWIDDAGILERSDINTEENQIQYLPLTDVVIVKPQSQQYNLYAFKFSGYGIGGFIIDNLPRDVLSGIFEVTEPGSIINLNPIIKYQMFRDLFLLISIISLLIAWIFTAAWVFMDARAKKLKVIPWIALVLITNIIGLIVYLTVRPKYVTCRNCEKKIPKAYAVCPYCGSTEKETCIECGTVLEESFLHCPSCGKDKGGE